MSELLAPPRPHHPSATAGGEVPLPLSARRRADPGSRSHRLGHGPRFQVRRLVVEPGGRLALRSHVHRAQHWVVVSGTADVMLGGCRRLVSENDSVQIPVGQMHGLRNPGRIPVVLIAVETGCYLGDDDIARHEDDADAAETFA